MRVDISKKRKIGIVFSGGGLKAAAFHIGVCLALKEKGFRFAGGTKEQVRKNFPEDAEQIIRMYVGSSAGSFVASILSAGYSIEALINAFEIGRGQAPHFSEQGFEHSLGHLKPISYKNIFDLNGRNIIKSIPLAFWRRSVATGGLETLIKDRFKINGFFTAGGIEKYLSQYALSHNEFRQLGVDLFVIGTQLNHTRKVIFGNFPETSKTQKLMYVNYAKISEAVAASVSLPPVFAPYMIRDPKGKDMFFFDGEIRDSLSTHVATDNGADLVIASYSYQPYHYTNEVGSLDKFGIPAILNQALYQVIQQKIDRHIQYKNDVKNVYDSIDSYCVQNKISEQHREHILEIIREGTRYKPQVNYLYIHPRPQDHEMFFADHFSLGPEILEKIVKIGFRSAIQQLRHFNL